MPFFSDSSPPCASPDDRSDRTGEAHRLVIDHRCGVCVARCSCGDWVREPVAVRLSRFRPVHARLVAEHRRHVGEAEVCLRTA